MTAADYLMLISMVCIWALMAINVFLSVGGFLYYHQCSKTDGHVPIDEYPFVSIMVPAHNESVVIRRTVRALLNFDYPHDRYEIIVINDNSTDDTANVLKQIQAANPGRNLIVVNTDNVVGGKGKSNALNIGYSVAKGSVERNAHCASCDGSKYAKWVMFPAVWQSGNACAPTKICPPSDSPLFFISRSELPESSISFAAFACVCKRNVSEPSCTCVFVSSAKPPAPMTNTGSLLS